jgi:hypothetical protein
MRLFRILRSVGWQYPNDVSGQRIAPHNHEDRTESLSRNFVKKLPSVRKVAVQLSYGTVRTVVDITSNIFYKCTETFRNQICRTCLRIKLNRFKSVSTLVDITSNNFYKCTATFRTQICRKCLRIKLYGFRPV